jgi:uncharacterized membrane protein YgcG
MARTPYGALAAALLGWLVAVAPVSAAVPPVIKDDAKFFSDKARTEADAKIKEIYRDFHKDLFIETLPSVPPDKAKDVNLKDRSARERFFEEWARERFRNAGVNGIYVLICKDPPHIQVEVGNETREKAFTVKDRDELAKILLSRFREKKYDEGLREAVDFVAARLKANGVRAGTRRAEGDRRRAAAPPAAVPGGHNRGGSLMDGIGGWICIGLVVLAGVWLLVGLFRALTGAGAGYRGGYGPGGPGP